MNEPSAGLPMTGAYFRLILGAYGGTARDRAELLAGTGVSEERIAGGGEIALGQQLRQIQNANRRLAPDWALSMGRSFHPATHGPIGVATVSAPTLRRSLEVMTRFSTVRSPHFRLTARARGDEIHLVPDDRVELDEPERRSLLEIVLLSTQGMIEAALGRAMGDARFDIPYRASDERAYIDAFHAPVRFGRGAAAVVIPARWLDLACPLAEPALFAASLESLANGERRLAGDRYLAARIEEIIARSGEQVGVETVARILGTTRRTLARRLRRGGTSFRDVVEARRKRRAEALLADRGLAVAEIGYALGYEDAANFGRACRRWFGMSPAAVRDRLRAEPERASGEYAEERAAPQERPRSSGPITAFVATSTRR